MKIDRSITIGRPLTDVYQFWRSFENLPLFMEHLESVHVLDPAGTRSHWVAKAPLNKDVEWDAEITVDRPNEVIAWHSLPDSQIDNAGKVEFKEAPSGRGTEIHVNLDYNPPAGTAGSVIARLLGEEPEIQIHEDLHRLKQILEVGEIATVTGQTSGRQKEVEEERGRLNSSKERAR